MYPVKQATSLELPFFVHDENGDAVTGLADGDFTKRISKNGATFGAMTTSIAEMENGWYSTTLSTSHTDTLGIMTIVFTHASAEQTNLQFRVFSRINDDFAFPTTSGRSIDVASAGTVGVDLDNTTGTLAKDTDLTGFNDPTAGSVADAVWDEAKADHVTSTSFGYMGSEITAVLVDTGEIGAAGAGLSAIPWNSNWDAEVQSEVQDVVGAGGSLLSAIPWNSDWDAEVESEVADGIANNEVTVATNNDKTGYALSAAGIDSIWDEVMENSKTARQFMRIMKSALAGKSTGGGSATNNFRDDLDTKNRIVASVDADGNRTSVTVDGN